MSSAALTTTKQSLPEDIETVLVGGDLAPLNPQQRVVFYNKLCESLGLNPMTKPFEYIRLNGKITLYARKDCTEQLRNIHSVSITIVAREVVEDVYIVTARATKPNGRTDESIGAVPLPKGGEAKANAMMKAETKSKRRVTLSICGLGMLDETEIETIPSAQVVAEPADPTPSRPSSNGSGKAASSAAPRVLKETPENPTVEDYLARIRGLESPPECEAWEKKHLPYINENFSQDEIQHIADAYYARKEELQQEWDAAASEPPDLNLWGSILKAYREEHGLTPDDLAKEIGVRTTTLTKIFAKKKVSAGTLKKVSDFVVKVSAPQ